MNNKLFKYAPNRLFRKGDKVRLCEYNGRAPFDNENFEEEEAGQLCIIAENEDYENAYSLHVWKLEDMEREPDDGERSWFAFPLMFMELVTPVEEAEPFYIERDDEYGCYFVRKDDGETTAVDTLAQAFYFKTEDFNAHYYTEEQAKKLANETCNRLNAEYRKEQSND